jgi:L-fuconolactonase
MLAVQSSPEPIIEPELQIVDAHHHLWDFTDAALAAMEARDSIAARALARTCRLRPRYLFDELRTDLNSGHNICASIFVEANTMYRARGAEAMKSVGEVEYVNGVAAMAASGLYGEAKVCAGIVGGVNLALGDAVEEILIAHIHAGGGRYRGVRCPVVFDEDATILGAGCVPHLLLDPTFRRGFKKLGELGLSFDALLLEPQLPELIDIARAFPGTQIILNHVGAPLVVGRFAGKREERFLVWRDNIRRVSQCANVAVKLGGLGIPFGGFSSHMSNPPATSLQLAEEWRPYIETCIEAFGVERCMFESNFPVDAAAGSYPVIWNAFKRIAAAASRDEKTALFSDTATRIYRLSIES